MTGNSSFAYIILTFYIYIYICTFLVPRFVAPAFRNNKKIMILFYVHDLRYITRYVVLPRFLSSVTTVFATVLFRSFPLVLSDMSHAPLLLFFPFLAVLHLVLLCRASCAGWLRSCYTFCSVAVHSE